MFYEGKAGCLRPSVPDVVNIQLPCKFTESVTIISRSCTHVNHFIPMTSMACAAVLFERENIS